MAVTPSNARPFYGNGHYYLFTKEGASWGEARDRSAATSINGESGYLATITSQAENDFIKSYSYNGITIPNDGFIAGSDDHRYYASLGATSDGQWVWTLGPEAGTKFWSGGGSGSTVNGSFAGWSSGNPDNRNNQDYLVLYANGYWDDRDSKNVGGYVTEWGRAGAEYNISFAALNSSDNQNGTEGGKFPSIKLNIDRFVNGNYTNFPGTTPLIDIPISFGGTAALGDDYTLEITDRNGTSSSAYSYYTDGRLHVLDTDQVTLTFRPVDDKEWDPIRTIQVSLSPDGSENIYAIDGNRNIQVWLFDDEPQLSLGQGAWQYIRTPYVEGSSGSLPNENSSFVEDDDVLIIDENGIDENDGTFGNLGLYDLFAARWETYLRVPETGSYTFKTISDDGVKLTLRRNNSSGAELAKIDQWKDQGTTQYSTQSLSLTQGDVVWIRYDYYEAGGAANAQLLWDRPGATQELIPASAMFLSETLARGTNQQEPSEADSFAPGFQIFSNKKSSQLNVALTSSSESSGSTYQTNTAQRQQSESTKVGDDYRLETPNKLNASLAGTNISIANIGINGTYGTLGWTPDGKNFSEANVQTINLAVLPDPYAEYTESVTLTLKESAGYGVRNDGLTNSTVSQTVLIEDDPFVLSIDPINTFGQVAWSAVMSRDQGIEASPAGGVPLRMDVTGIDPYTETVNNSRWNIAKAGLGETWTFSIYARADRATTGQLFIFEADADGSVTRAPAKTIELSTEWQRYSFTETFSNASTEYIQVRLDGPDSRDAVQPATIWWDGLQVEQAAQASAFTRATDINRFADNFNPLDLYNGTQVVNTTEGDWGWITFNTGGRPAPESGMRVLYDITGGSASQGLEGDYLAPKSTLSTTSFNPQNYVTLAPNATEGRIYISALADAIKEGNETVTITLKPDKQTDSNGFSYQQYNIGAGNSATLTIRDSDLYQPAVVITPESRNGQATIRSRVNENGVQEATFDLHLASKPQADVSIQLTTTSGNLEQSSVVFTPENWDQPQTIRLTNQSSQDITSITARSSSSDGFYNALGTEQTIVPSSWPDDLILSLWEGGVSNPVLPVVSIVAIDGEEEPNSQLGFTFNLNTALTNDLTIRYSLNGGAGFQLSGTQADVKQAPTAQADGTYTLTIPAGSTSASLSLIPRDDQTAEGSEQISATLISSDPELTLRLDGATGYAETASNIETLNITGDITLEATITLAQRSNDWVRLVGKGKTSGSRPYGLWLATDGTILFQKYGNSGSLNLRTTETVPVGEKTHVAATHNAATGETIVYINGKPAAQTTQQLQPHVNSDPLTVGYAGYHTYLNGDIEDVKVWSVARDAQQIQQSEVSGDEEGLVAYFPVASVDETALINQSPLEGIDANLIGEATKVVSNSFDVYTFGGSTGTATANLKDNDNAGVVFAVATDSSINTTKAWTSTSQIRVSETDQDSSNSTTTVGISLSSEPQSDVTLLLNRASIPGNSLVVKALGSPSPSPVGGAPLRMEVNGIDPYTKTYNSSLWNIASASAGETWTVSVYAKADQQTTGQLFLFEADAKGKYTSAPAKTIQLGTEWQRYSFSTTFANPTTEFIQLRLDGPNDREAVQHATIWWDGLQLEKSGEVSSFTLSESTNQFARNFNPLDLYNGYTDSTADDFGKTANSAEMSHEDFDVSLTFTPENWSVPQALELQAVNEDEDDGDQNLLVSFTASSDDPNYASLASGLSVLVLDDDANRSNAAPSDSSRNGNDPLAVLSGPSTSELKENSDTGSQYTVTLPEVTDFDRLIFLDLDDYVTTADRLDFTINGVDSRTSATGLTVFSANADTYETTSIDSDAIRENADTFSALGLKDNFTVTWSGYIYIPESGSYNFSTDLQGGARLSIDGTMIIDKLFDSDAVWQSDAIQLSGGEFVALNLDYQSFDAPDPSIELRWTRPNSRSENGFSEETIGESHFSRVGGHHLIVPAGSSSASFSIVSNDDFIKEDDKQIGFKLLSPRGVEIIVTSQSIDEQDTTQLGLQLNTTDREAITLPAGTELKLGVDTESESNSVATFRFTEAATIHRDRSASVNGVLSFVDRHSGTDSVIGLVGADNSAQYQLLDPAVDVTLASVLERPAESTTETPAQYTTALQLAETNRGELLLPAGSELDFQLPSVDIGITLISALYEVDAQAGTYTVDLQRSDNDPTDVVLPAGFSFDFTTEQPDQTFTLIIPNNLELAAGAGVSGLSVQISAITDGLEIGNIEPGLSSTEQLTRIFSLRLNDDLRISSGDTVTDVAVSAFDSTNGLDLTTLEPGLSSSYVIPNTALLTIRDNEKAGLLFSTDGSGEQVINESNTIVIQEDGSGQTRYVKLTSQPTNSVTVYLETSDSSEALLQAVSSGTEHGAAKSRIALTFNPDNWNSSQAFSIVPVDDKTIDGTVDLGIYSRTNSSDPFYQENRAGNLNAPQKRLTVSVADNDEARVLIELQQSSLNEAENGFLNFSLTAEPSADVVLTLTPSDHQFSLNDRGIGQGETITFTPDNWKVIQTLELHAVDDTTVEDVTSSHLTISSTSEDSAFADLAINPIRIDVIDNDLPTASIIPVTDSSEEAAPGRFRIELSNSAPSSAGSSGVVVNYEITSVTLDSDKLGYASEPGSINKVTQSPGAITGQVRIAPGQRSSDVFVVPIDDFVADSFDKSFTVSLVEGVDYVLDQQSNTNQATVHIINNDVAGIVILLSGDTLRVSESGDPGEFNIALLSQPGSDVKLTLREQQLNGVRQLGSADGTPYSQTLTFTPDNWFIAQRASVKAYDDFIIEDESTTGELIIFDANGKPVGGTPLYSGLHPTQLQYTFESDDSDYDSTGPNSFTRTLQNVDVLDIELPAETADSLQNALTNLQEGIDSLALPMVGSLDGKTGGGLRKFITNLANSIRAIGTPTPAKLSQLISEAINGAIGKEVADVSLSMKGTEAIDVGFNFSDNYDVASIPLDAEFGLPGLGLQSQGSIDANFSYDANLAFSFPREGDPVLITTPSNAEEPDKTEYTNLNANFTTSLSPDFELTGGLGFLQLDAVNQESPNEEVQIGGEPASTEMQVNFELDLAGGAGADGSLSFDELTSPNTNLEDLFQYRIEGDAAVSLGVTTSVNGSAAIPSFSFDLSSLLPLFDYSNIEEAEDQENSASVFFDNIKLDLGSYITQMLDPIVGGIDDIINPLYPIVDALYADTQIFNTIGLTKTFDNDKDGKVSAIDLAEWFADIYAFIDPVKGADLKKTIDATIEFLDTVKGVMDLIEDLKAMSEEGNFYIDFGSYTLSDFRVGDGEETTPKVSDPDDDTPAADDTRSDTSQLSTDTGNQADAGAGSSSFAAIMQQLDELGFQIPLIDDPKNAIDLLLGNPVDLFTWTMPSMGMESEIEESFPIYSGVDGIIEGGFGVDARIGFGFDTSGLQEWMDSGFVADDFWKVFNGFYVNDRDANGNDAPEFTLNASMGAGLGLTAVVVKSSITGGLEAEASLDLMDEGEIAGTDDGKIYGDEIISRLDNPLDLFELVGSLAAYLKAKVQVGIDAGFYSIWDTVWEDKLAEIPIFEFGVGGSYGSGTASNGYLNGSTVFFDANSNGRIDQLEPSTIVGEDSHYNLRIDQRTFDTNRNGIIDASEGRLMVFGGTDSTTGLPLEIPMLAPLGQMITPFTTLHTLALDLGYSDAEIKNQLDSLFKLDGFDYLTHDPLLGIKQAKTIEDTSIRDDLATYVGHIKLMVGLTIFANTLEQADPKRTQNLPNTFSNLTAFADALLEQSILTPDEDQAISNALLAIADSPYANLADGEIDLAREVSEFASAASAEFNARVNELLRSYQGDATTTEVLSALHSLKQEVISSYQANTNRLSEGLYRIAGSEAQFNELSSRLAAAHGDFIQLTKPQPTPSNTTEPESPSETVRPESNSSTEPPATSANPSSAEPTSSLTPTSIRTLTRDEITLLSAEDVSKIPAIAVAALSRNQVAALRAEAMRGFNASQIEALKPNVIASLKRTQLRQLSPDALAGLTPKQAAELKPKQVSAFTANQIAQLQKNTFKQLDAQDLRRLKADAITGLTEEFVSSLSKRELSAFAPSQIKAINADAITGFNPSTLNRLEPDLIQAFTRKQIGSLSPQQIRKSRVFIDNLSDQQRNALSTLDAQKPENTILAEFPSSSSEINVDSFPLS